MRCNVAVVCAALLLQSCRVKSGEPAGGSDLPAPEAAAVARASVPLGLEDRGIFGDLDPDVSMGIPECVGPPGVHIVVSREKRTLSLYYLGVAVKTYPVLEDPPPDGEHTVEGVLVRSGSAPSVALRDEDFAEISGVVEKGTKVLVVGEEQGDADSDGIPDQVDVHAGAIKCALDGASYDSAYAKISFPMGDVPRDKGSCADVVVRALRNAGLDLQELVQEDIAARPKAYGIAEPNPSIDHRRVRNLLVYMKKHFTAVESDAAGCAYLPGDIVFLDTLPKKGPDHVGIVTWTTSGDGLPLVINSWTWGYETSAMGLLSWLDVTHRFRVR